MKKVFIDGSAGTTGLQIRERLQTRNDIELLTLSEEMRKDTNARKEMLNLADIAFLCLPDEAAVEAVSLIENSDTCIIDTSTAHRTNENWVYGFPEIVGFDKIKNAKRIANPGCHATGFVSIVYPLIKNGVLPANTNLTCFSLTGYSGGGKKMIAQYEDDTKNILFSSPAIYGLGQNHKHLPEMKKVCCLENTPVFCPIVDDYYKGMATTVPFFTNALNGTYTLQDIRQILTDFYKNAPFIRVLTEDETENQSKIYGNGKSGKDSLEIIVCGNSERFTVTSLFDNLGKGASGSAIENMNIVMGVDPTTALVL